LVKVGDGVVELGVVQEESVSGSGFGDARTWKASGGRCGYVWGVIMKRFLDTTGKVGFDGY
jgi:hypothetical protein